MEQTWLNFTSRCRFIHLTRSKGISVLGGSFWEMAGRKVLWLFSSTQRMTTLERKGLRRPSNGSVSGGRLNRSYCGYPPGYSDSKHVAMKVSFYMAQIGIVAK